MVMSGVIEKSSYLKYQDGVHVPILGINQEGNNVKLTINGVAGHLYKLEESTNLSSNSWYDAGRWLSIEDVSGRQFQQDGTVLEEITQDKPIIHNSCFWRAVSKNVSDELTDINALGIGNNFNNYELANLDSIENTYAYESVLTQKLLQYYGTSPLNRPVVFYDKDPSEMSWPELQYWLNYVGIESSCLSSGYFSTQNYKNLSITLLKLFEGKILPYNNSKVPLTWINNYNSWNEASLKYLYVQKGIDSGTFGGWRNVSYTEAERMVNQEIAPTPDTYVSLNGLANSFPELALYTQAEALDHQLLAVGVSGFMEKFVTSFDKGLLDYAGYLVGKLATNGGNCNFIDFIKVLPNNVESQQFIELIDIVRNHKSSADELVSLYRYRKVIEQEYKEEAEQMFKSFIIKFDDDLLQAVNTEILKKTEFAITWLQNNGYVGIDKATWILKPFASIAIYHAVKSIVTTTGDIKIDINLLFSNYDECVSNKDYNVAVLTDYLRNNQIYKGENTFASLFYGNISSQREYVAPRYNDILEALKLRLILATTPIPTQHITETADSINKLLNNIDYQKLLALQRFVIDINMYETSLKLSEYTQNNKLSFADYFSYLNSGKSAGLINYLATKNYFENPIEPGKARVFYDTVGKYNVLYSGQGIYVQEPGELYYKISGIVMQSHFSVLEKLPVGGMRTLSLETEAQLSEVQQRELFFHLINQGYITSKGAMTDKFFTLLHLAEASSDKYAYIGQNFLLPTTLRGYEVSAFKKIEQLLLGEWKAVNDNVIPVGGDSWVNSADHTLHIAKKVNGEYQEIFAKTFTYFDAIGFVAMFDDVKNISELTSLGYSKDTLSDRCLELYELMSDNGLLDSEIPNLKSYLAYRSQGKDIVMAYLMSYFEKINVVKSGTGGFPTINYTAQDVAGIFEGLSQPLGNDFFASIGGVTASDSLQIINLLKTKGVLSASGKVSQAFDITNSNQDLGVNGTAYEQYAHQVFTMLSLQKKAAERKFFNIIINLVDIQSRLSISERAQSYELKDYVCLSEDFHNYNPDQIVKLRDMFAFSNILGKTLTASSISNLITAYDSTGNALDAVLLCTGTLSASSEIQGIIAEYNPIIYGLANSEENVLYVVDTDEKGQDFLKLGEVKNIASLNVYHRGQLIYTNNDYEGLSLVKKIPLPEGSSLDELTLEIRYVDTTTETKTIYPLIAKASNNEETAKQLKVLEEMSRELDNSLKLYGITEGKELVDFRAYISDLAKMYISAKVLALKSGSESKLSAQDVVNVYATALIAKEFPGVSMPSNIWKKVWLINNENKLSLFDNDIKDLLLKSCVDLNGFSNETNRQGERYQILLGGVGYTEGAGCGNTAGFGQGKVIGVLDTYTGQVIQVPAEVISNSRDVKWISDTGQLERKQRDLAVESAQSTLPLKSFYACQLYRETKAEDAMSFDVSTAKSWKDIVADSETAVKSYADILLQRKNFITELMRNVTGQSTLSEEASHTLYAKFLSSFKDYLPHSSAETTIIYPTDNMNYIHKENEPKGYYVSKEAVLLLQRMKKDGNVTTLINNSGYPLNTIYEKYLDVETMGIVQANALLAKTIKPTESGVTSLVEPTVANLYGALLTNMLKDIFSTKLTKEQAVEILPIIQAKYPNLISEEETGKIGVATFAVLSYLQVIKSKNLMPEFMTISDLPEMVSVQAEGTGTAFQFMKVTDKGMLEVVFSPSGNVTASVYADGNVRTKTLNSSSDMSVKSFTGDDLKVLGDSEVKIGAIANFSPQYPRSGAYNEYGWVNVVGEIAKNLLVSMIIGEVTGLFANMAGMKDLYTLYNTTSTGVNLAKATLSGQIQGIARDMLRTMVPAGIMTAVDTAVVSYQQFENNYNIIKRDIDKYTADYINGQNVVQNIQQQVNNVNTSIRQAQIDIDKLKQDISNRVGVYANMTEEQLQKATEQIQAFERQLSYVEYHANQKLIALQAKVPQVQAPVIPTLSVDKYSIHVSKLKVDQYKNLLLIGFESYDSMPEEQASIFVTVGNQTIETTLKHQYKKGSNFLTIDMDELIASLTTKGITLTNGQKIKIFGKEVTVSTNYTQADLSNATQESEVLAKCAEIDAWLMGSGVTGKTAVYDETKRELTVTLTANPVFWFGKGETPVNAYMVLSDGKVHQVKIGEITDRTSANTSRNINIKNVELHYVISECERKNGLGVMGLYKPQKMSISGNSLTMQIPAPGSLAYQVIPFDKNVVFENNGELIKILDNGKPKGYYYLEANGELFPVDASQYKAIYPGKEDIADAVDLGDGKYLRLVKTSPFIAMVNGGVSNFDVRLFKTDTPIVKSQLTTIIPMLNSTNSRTLQVTTMIGINYNEFWSSVKTVSDSVFNRKYYDLTNEDKLILYDIVTSHLDYALDRMVSKGINKNQAKDLINNYLVKNWVDFMGTHDIPSIITLTKESKQFYDSSDINSYSKYLAVVLVEKTKNVGLDLSYQSNFPYIQNLGSIINGIPITDVYNYAAVSDWVYGKGKTPLPVGYQNITSEFIIQGDTVQQSPDGNGVFYSDPSTGYQAAILKKPNGDLVMVSRGTEQGLMEIPFGYTDWADLAVDALMVIINSNKQFIASKKLYDRVNASSVYKNKNIIHTGHSLGGANANLLAVWARTQTVNHNDQSIVFNAPGIKEILANKNIDILKSLTGNERLDFIIEMDVAGDLIGGFLGHVDSPRYIVRPKIKDCHSLFSFMD
jgi:hypothetical protein